MRGRNDGGRSGLSSLKIHSNCFDGFGVGFFRGISKTMGIHTNRFGDGFLLHHGSARAHICAPGRSQTGNFSANGGRQVDPRPPPLLGPFWDNLLLFLCF